MTYATPEEQQRRRLEALSALSREQMSCCETTTSEAHEECSLTPSEAFERNIEIRSGLSLLMSVLCVLALIVVIAIGEHVASRLRLLHSTEDKLAASQAVIDQDNRVLHQQQATIDQLQDTIEAIQTELNARENRDLPVAPVPR